MQNLRQTTLLVLIVFLGFLGSIASLDAESKLTPSAFYPEVFVGNWQNEPFVNPALCNSIIRYNLLAFAGKPKWLVSRKLYFTHSKDFCPLEIVTLSKKKTILFKSNGKVVGLYCASDSSLGELLEKYKGLLSLSVNVKLDTKDIESILKHSPDLLYLCYEDFENLDVAHQTFKLSKLKVLCRHDGIPRERAYRNLTLHDHEILQFDHPNIEYIAIRFYPREYIGKHKANSPNIKYAFFNYYDPIVLTWLDSFSHLTSLGICLPTSDSIIERIHNLFNLTQLSIHFLQRADAITAVIDLSYFENLMTLQVSGNAINPLALLPTRVLSTSSAKSLISFWVNGLVFRFDYFLPSVKNMVLQGCNISFSKRSLAGIHPLDLLVIKGCSIGIPAAKKLCEKVKFLSLPYNLLWLPRESNLLEKLQFVLHGVNANEGCMIDISDLSFGNIKALIISDESARPVKINSGDFPTFVFSVRLDDKVAKIESEERSTIVQVKFLDFFLTKQYSKLLNSGFILKFPARTASAFGSPLLVRPE